MKKIVNMQEMGARVLVLLAGLLIAVGVAQAATTIGTNIVLNPTLSGASSAQSVEADATLSSFTGGYGAAVMGNVMGTAAAGDSIIGGIIGKYNVGTNPSDHPAAAVVGEIGEDSAGTSDGAFVAVIGGDGGAVTSGAAFTVRNLNSTNGNGFSYGLDLNTTTIDSYQPLSFGSADIRLVNGETISNGTNGTVAIGATLVTGNFILPTSVETLVDGADGGASCAAANKGAIVIDAGNAFFGCDGTNWQALTN